MRGGDGGGLARGAIGLGGSLARGELELIGAAARTGQFLTGATQHLARLARVDIGAALLCTGLLRAGLPADDPGKRQGHADKTGNQGRA